MTPAYGFMLLGVPPADNFRNVKTNRGGVTGHITSYHAKILLYFYAIFNHFPLYYYVYFIVHIVTVLFNPFSAGIAAL